MALGPRPDHHRRTTTAPLNATVASGLPLAPMAGTTVAFLFVDLVGSTELRHRLGDDANDELTRRYLGVLREAVTRHRGTEVKSLGDGLMVAFPGALGDSVACGVDMQRGIAGLSRRDPLRKLQIRVGISAGEVTCEADDWSGTPIVEAARLVAKARPGVILANDVIRGDGRLAGRLRVHSGRCARAEGVPGSAAGVRGRLGTRSWSARGAVAFGARRVARAAVDGPRLRARRARTARSAGSIPPRLGLSWSRVRPGSAGTGSWRSSRAGSMGMVRRRCCSVGARMTRRFRRTGLSRRCGGGLRSVPPDVVRRAVDTDGGRLAVLVPSLTARLPELVESPIVVSSDVRVEALAGMVARVALVTPLVVVLDGTGGFDRETGEVVLASRRWIASAARRGDRGSARRAPRAPAHRRAPARRSRHRVDRDPARHRCPASPGTRSTGSRSRGCAPIREEIRS